MPVIVYSSIMIENRPESVRTVRSIGGAKFLVAQAFAGPFGWLTRTLNRKSVGRGFEPRPPHFRDTGPLRPVNGSTVGVVDSCLLVVDDRTSSIFLSSETLGRASVVEPTIRDAARRRQALLVVQG
jgi:hypothetical protein